MFSERERLLIKEKNGLMDSVTHVVLGAVIGEAAFRRSSVKHGMLVGAVAQSLPDIDFVAALWLSPAENMLAHRGITHSLLFAVIASFFGAFLMQILFRKIKTPFHHWFSFLALQILLHLSIDAMNSYGVGLLEPFDNTRTSLHILFVADPLFSLWPGIAALVLIILKPGNPQRRFWAYFGIIPCMIYFVVAVVTKMTVEQQIKHELDRQRILNTKQLITPAPLTSFLWYIVAETDDGFVTGYHSVFDKEGLIDLTYIPRNEHLLGPFEKSNDVALLRKFSQEYFVVSMKGDTVVFSDMRFGQIFGWNNPNARFVFQYYLNYPDENLLALQRGRFANWNLANIRRYLKRISGDKTPVPALKSERQISTNRL